MNDNYTVENMTDGLKSVCERLHLMATLLEIKLNEIIDANKRELAAKDALITKLVDALKKIDDACDGDMCKHFVNNEHCSKCVYLETCQTGIAHNALKTNESEIAKSREACK